MKIKNRSWHKKRFLRNIETKDLRNNALNDTYQFESAKDNFLSFKDILDSAKNRLNSSLQ